jgi:RHS repeat-associated protein
MQRHGKARRGTVRTLDNVRVQGLYIEDVPQGGSVLFDKLTGPSLASCVVKGSVAFTGCADAMVVGNTFDFRDEEAEPNLTVTNCTNAALRNNIFLNRTGATGLSVTGDNPDSDYNDWWPTNRTPQEGHSLNADPLLTGEEHRISSMTSPVVGRGVTWPDPNDPNAPEVAPFDVDIRSVGRYASPCLGAWEMALDRVPPGGRDAAGRLVKRVVGDREYNYAYEGAGRLTDFTDHKNHANDATYTYDFFGRRVSMTVGTSTTRFIYDGEDVVAELVDEDGNGTVDRTRYYWTLPEIDQRIGFVDVDAEGVHWYYYLCDQVGSVLAVVNEQGQIVNQYDYDAFGNLHTETSFERVPNRYRFHGREYDEHRGHYYYRFRIYIPEWGSFTTPDPHLNPTEPEGACNYLFCGNDPVGKTDPMGLFAELFFPDQVTIGAGGNVYHTVTHVWGDEQRTHLGRLFRDSLSGLMKVRLAEGGAEVLLSAVMEQSLEGMPEGGWGALASAEAQRKRDGGWTDANLEGAHLANAGNQKLVIDTAGGVGEGGVRTAMAISEVIAATALADALVEGGPAAVRKIKELVTKRGKKGPSAPPVKPPSGGGGGPPTPMAGGNPIRLHHPWPKYLSELEDQTLVALPKDVHDAYHAGLDKVLPRKWTTEFYRFVSPEEQAANFEKFRQYTERFDAQYGTQLWEAVKKIASTAY